MKNKYKREELYIGSIIENAHKWILAIYKSTKAKLSRFHCNQQNKIKISYPKNIPKVHPKDRHRALSIHPNQKKNFKLRF